MKCAVGGELLACQDHCHRNPVWELTDGSVDHAGFADDAGTYFRQPEAGIVGSDDDVGAHRQFEPAPEDVPVDERHKRFAELPQRTSNSGEPASEPDASWCDVGAGADVPASTERTITGASKDSDPYLGVRIDFFPPPSQLFVDGGVDRIQFARPVQHDMGDVVVDGVQQFLAHQIFPVHCIVVTDDHVNAEAGAPLNAIVLDVITQH